MNYQSPEPKHLPDQSTKDEIYAGLRGALDHIEWFHNKILVATYIRGAKTAGGVYIPASAQDEDKWQGRTGLVLKKGRMAFVNDARNDFHGQNVDIGDWVIYNVNNGRAIQIYGVHCRMIEDIHIEGKTDDPTIIW